MHVADMTTLYAYNRWANQRLIAAAMLLSAEQFLAPSAFPHSSLRNTLGHMIRTEWAWCAVLRGDLSDPPPSLRNEAFLTAAVIEARWNAIQAETQSYLASLRDADLARVLPLQSGGALTVWQVLMNLYTHSAQHRGEVAQILTEHGCSPGDIDYLSTKTIRRVGHLTILRDVLAVVLVAIGIASIGVQVAYVAAALPTLPPLLPLHYNGVGSVDLIGPRSDLFKMPGIGAIVFVVDLVLAMFVYRQERWGALTLLAGSILVQIMLIVATINIVRLAFGD